MPLAESRGGASGGVWGNAPTVPRQIYSKKTANKGAGSEASLPVTLRFLRSAPKLLFPTSMLCRARWARPNCWSFRHSCAVNQECFFPNAGISPLRRRPKGNENRRSLRSPFGNLRTPMLLEFYCKFFRLYTYLIINERRMNYGNRIDPRGGAESTSNV